MSIREEQRAKQALLVTTGRAGAQRVSLSFFLPEGRFKGHSAAVGTTQTSSFEKLKVSMRQMTPYHQQVQACGPRQRTFRTVQSLSTEKGWAKGQDPKEAVYWGGAGCSVCSMLTYPKNYSKRHFHTRLTRFSPFPCGISQALPEHFLSVQECGKF